MKATVRVLAAIAFLLAGVSVDAQTITAVEYFIDSDPGFGSGTAVSVTTGVTIDHSFPVDISSISDGFHTLFVRAKNNNNNWSIPYSRPFFKLSLAEATPAIPNINKLEYFVDNDPGVGSGTDLPVTPATSINNHVVAIPLSSISEGFHTLWIRARDANNKWSEPYSRPFYKLATSAVAPIPNVNKVEYFVDADPGLGAGVNVPVTPGTTITNLNISVAVGALPEGTHQLTVRARDANNNWSIVVIRNFSVCNHPGTTLDQATNITSSSFTATWVESPGSIGYLLDVSTDNFNTYVPGYQAMSISAPNTSVSVTGLSQATAYQYRVMAVAACTSVASNVVAVNTLATPPSAQPANFQFSSVTANSFTGFFTAPSPAPTGYLIVRKTGSSPTFVPSNNTNYAVGQSVGDGMVVHFGSSFLFNQSSLAPDTRYYFDVFAYNQSNGSTTYLATSPLEGNVSTIALEPTAQPTNMQFSSVTDVSFNVSFSAAAGNPGGYLVVRRSGSAPTSVPVDGNVYTSTVGTDAVVYNGVGTNFSQTGLVQNTQYHYAVYAYNGSGTSINYRTTTPLQGSQLTPIGPPATPAALTFTSVTPVSMTLSYTAPVNAPSGYLVIQRVGASPTFIPQLNTSYSTGPAGDGLVVYTGSATSVELTGLVPSTDYHFDVYAFNQQGALISYQVVGPLEGNKSTFTAEPTAQPTGISLADVTGTSLKVTYVAANPPPAGYIVLRRNGATPNAAPVDGASYSTGATIGEVTVAYTGPSLSFTDNALVPGTTYFYQVLSFNGSGASTNYFTQVTADNSASMITRPGKPSLSGATSVGQQLFTVNWSAVQGASAYQLDVSTDNFISKVAGFDNLTVNATAKEVTGLEPGLMYQYRVRAVNSSGASPDSDIAQQYTISPTPTLLPAEAVGQTTMTIRWNASTGATGYQLDISTDQFATFISNYNSKALGAVTTETVNSLNPGTNYQFRVRATNDGGTSPSSSPTGSQLLYPATPGVLDPPPASSAGFTAKWTKVDAATEYRLDVSLSSTNFNPPLPNYTNLAVAPKDQPDQLVIGLLPNTAYLYRVRAVNATGASPSSATKEVLTAVPGTGVDLGFNAITFNETFSASSEILAVAQGGTPPYGVVLYYRHITAADYSVRQLANPTGSTFRAIVSADMLDDIGMDFYLAVTDGTGARVESDRKYIYRPVPSAGIRIPLTRFGGTPESYEIFSIPYEMTPNLVGSIFDELGEVNKTMWRLVRYQGGKNTDLGLVGTIEPGKGYWINRRENVDISFSGGTSVKRNQEDAFVMQLERGWNQIGNPFPFDIHWQDVLDANPNVSSVGKLRTFNPTGLHLNDESATLKAWSGGFVHNGSNQATTIELPVTLKNTTGGRTAGREIATSRLDSDTWFVPIKLRHGAMLYATAGVGMHPEASVTYDRFDNFAAPRFINYLELYSEHRDYQTPRFTADVVPTADGYSWFIHFASSESAVEAELTWDNTGFGANSAQLLLYDAFRNSMIDMRRHNSYRFTPAREQQFRILFGKGVGDINPGITTLSNPYPNPFGEQVTIPLLVADRARVQITIIDAMGRQVTRLADGEYAAGIHFVNWNGTDENGNLAARGVYFVTMSSQGRQSAIRIVKH